MTRHALSQCLISREDPNWRLMRPCVCVCGRTRACSSSAASCCTFSRTRPPRHCKRPTSRSQRHAHTDTPTFAVDMAYSGLRSDFRNGALARSIDDVLVRCVYQEEDTDLERVLKEEAESLRRRLLETDKELAVQQASTSTHVLHYHSMRLDKEEFRSRPFLIVSVSKLIPPPCEPSISCRLRFLYTVPHRTRTSSWRSCICRRCGGWKGSGRSGDATDKHGCRSTCGHRYDEMIHPS